MNHSISDDAQIVSTKGLSSMIYHGWEPPWQGYFEYEIPGRSERVSDRDVTLLTAPESVRISWQKQHSDPLWDGSGYAWEMCIKSNSPFGWVMWSLTNTCIAKHVKWFEDDLMPRLTGERDGRRPDHRASVLSDHYDTLQPTAAVPLVVEKPNGKSRPAGVYHPGCTHLERLDVSPCCPDESREGA